MHVQYYSTLNDWYLLGLLIVLQRMSGWLTAYWLRAPLFEIDEESYRFGFSNLTQLKTPRSYKKPTSLPP
jgi:hypothetical protein